MTDEEIQEERRINDSLVLELMKEVRGDLKSLREELNGHITEEPANLQEFLSVALGQAFVDGDLHGHRKAHIAWIAHQEAKTAHYDKLKYELTKWGLLGFVGWLAYQAWLAFLKGPTV